MRRTIVDQTGEVLGHSISRGMTNSIVTLAGRKAVEAAVPDDHYVNPSTGAIEPLPEVSASLSGTAGSAPLLLALTLGEPALVEIPGVAQRLEAGEHELAFPEPGRYRVLISAPARKPFEREVQVSE